MQRFDASPWATSLKVVSTLGTLVIAAAGVALLRSIPRETRVPFSESFGVLLSAVPVLVVLGALLFVVGGYELETGRLWVRRLLWSTSVPLDGLERAWHDPAAMRRSVRLFGNGGLYAITGLFQNPTLGPYRAFVTDPSKAVVLRFPARAVVVSPASPEAFLAHLRMLIPGLGDGPPASS